MRFGSRFTLLFGVLSALAAVLLLASVDATLRRTVEERVSERLSRELDHLSDDLLGAVASSPATRDQFLRQAAARLACRITLVAPDGRVLHETGFAPAEVVRMENHSAREEIQEASTRGTGQSRRYSTTARTEMLYFAKRLPNSAVLRVAVSAAHLQALERSPLWSSRAAVVIACFLLFFIGAIASRRFIAPIRRLTRAASAVAAGDFDRDLPTGEGGGEELRELGRSLQSMKEALARALGRAESERRLTATVFERLPDGLLIVDEKLHVVEANERFARMIGVPAPAGRALYDLLRHRALFEVFETTVRTGESSDTTVRLADDIVWQIMALPLPRGSRAAAVGVLRDVTRLERTEAMRRTFVADVSHELRTPIASIAAAAETLAEGTAEPAEVEHLHGVIRRQTDRMRELIDDLMDLAQIESGSIPLEMEEVALGPLLREVAQDLAPAALERGVTLEVRADAEAIVMGDRRRLGQVARNLLDNAIKFSPEGSAVDLEARREPGRTSLSITDRGPGIPKSERDKIFQRFYQIDRSRSKQRPGSGLGLSIVKHIAHLHGASVEVDGETGQGSTFRVVFPPTVS